MMVERSSMEEKGEKAPKVIPKISLGGPQIGSFRKVDFTAYSR
jgi:hypothetical protein